MIYKPGGICNYRQNLTLIKLRKINETTKKVLINCNFNDQPCYIADETSVNLSRGDSGFEFGLTLFNVTADSIGTYEVIVESLHPGSGNHLTLIKEFHLVGK